MLPKIQFPNLKIEAFLEIEIINKLFIKINYNTFYFLKIIKYEIQ